MCAYSNGFSSGRPLANQVPSAAALSHKLGTDVLGRAGFVDIVIGALFDVSPHLCKKLVSPLWPPSPSRPLKWDGDMRDDCLQRAHPHFRVFIFF